MKKTGMAVLVVATAALSMVMGCMSNTTVTYTPEEHPAYLHALSDLRDARAYLDRMSPNESVDEHEAEAIDQIDHAIGEIKKASIDDGKDIHDHVNIDAHVQKTDRYHRAIELLSKAFKDIKEKEDNLFAQGLQGRALEHIEHARKIVETIVASFVKPAPVTTSSTTSSTTTSTSTTSTTTTTTTTTITDVRIKHPAYLHALSDLRDARANLDKLLPSEVVDEKEFQAIEEIDRAIGEIKKASIDDGKDIHDHVNIDAHVQKTDRYHRAIELLNKVLHDIREKEDNQFAQGLQARALGHVEKALNIIQTIVSAPSVDVNAAHPAYLSALSDLRDARAYLDKLLPNEIIDVQESRAIEEIDQSIGEIKKASIDDHKDTKNHVVIDVHLGKTDRYHRAIELLKKAFHDIKEKEDNKFALGLQVRALGHIEKAQKLVESIEGIKNIESMGKPLEIPVTGSATYAAESVTTFALSQSCTDKATVIDGRDYSDRSETIFWSIRVLSLPERQTFFVGRTNCAAQEDKLCCTERQTIQLWKTIALDSAD